MNKSSKQPKWNVNGAVFYLRITWGTVYTQKLDQKSWCQVKNMNTNKIMNWILFGNEDGAMTQTTLRDFRTREEQRAFAAGHAEGVRYAKRLQEEEENLAYEDHDCHTSPEDGCAGCPTQKDA